MTPQIVFWIFVGLIIIDFVWDTVVDFLNARHFDDPVPEVLQDVYEEKSYRQSVAYKKAHFRLALFKSTFHLIAVLTILFLDGFALLDSFTAGLTDNPVMHSLLFFAFLLTAESMISLPFAYYATFGIEEKFGFNRSDLKTFISDKLKSLMLGLVFLFMIGYPVIRIYYQDPENFWWKAWVVVSAFSLTMNLLYSDIIVPLFNKQTPLSPGELRDRLETLASRTGFKIKDIYVIDGSKRSTKANAYFAGFGPRKRIVLYDTLIDDLTPEEIEAVLAHEIGHYQKKHIILNILISGLLTGITFYLLSIALKSHTLAQALGVDKPSFHTGVIAFALLYGVIEAVLSVFQNLISRKFEFQADRFAAEHGYASPLVSALKKLARKSFSNLTPHPLYVWMHYSHPPLPERIRNLKKE